MPSSPGPPAHASKSATMRVYASRSLTSAGNPTASADARSWIAPLAPSAARSAAAALALAI